MQLLNRSYPHYQQVCPQENLRKVSNNNEFLLNKKIIPQPFKRLWNYFRFTEYSVRSAPAQ